MLVPQKIFLRIFLDRRQPVPDFKLIKPPQQSDTAAIGLQQRLPKKEGGQMTKYQTKARPHWSNHQEVS
jgi:hypothetical protein